MKIAYLTAGAAGMFCGSCINDNALAKALHQLGHDCILIPVYTPIRTDDQDVSIDRVFMGGINVYLQQKMPWLAYTPRWLDAVLNQSWIINPLTKNAGKTSPKLLGALTVSMLQGTQGRQRKEFLRLIDWLEADIKPDVVVLTNLLIGGGIPVLKKRLKCKVFVTLQGDDIFLDSLPAPYRDQCITAMRKLVPTTDGFIVHSHMYAKLMSDLLSIPIDKIHVVPLGIDPSDFINLGELKNRPVPPVPSASAVPSVDGGSRISIGYLARMAPEKGLHQLVDAYISIAADPGMQHVDLKLAGWMGPQHAEYWSEQQTKIKRANLEHRVHYAGSVDRQGKRDFLGSIDLFCVPTTYAEPKGLFLLEAVASGLMYVEPSHGAFPELHQRLNHGWLCEAHSPQSLEATLRTALCSLPTNRSTPSSTIDELNISTHAQRVIKLFHD